ncbi:hypothetical protein F5X96DRAFT_619765 [Biscogniauxia mediterranea]|nr:hypothetical protein F5X96DRAFT_619765 [Biscogniauxia mediterranea]
MISRPDNLRPSPTPSLRARETSVIPKRRPQQRIKIKLVNYSIDRLAALYRQQKQEEELLRQTKEAERELRHQQQQNHPRFIKVYRAGRLQSIRDTTTNEIIYHAARDANKPILTTYLHKKCVAVTDWRGPTALYTYGASRSSQ